MLAAHLNHLGGTGFDGAHWRAWGGVGVQVKCTEISANGGIVSQRAGGLPASWRLQPSLSQH